MIRTWLIDAGGELHTRELAVPALEDDRVLVEVQGAVAGARELAALREAPGVVPGGAAVGVVVDTGDAATQLAGKRVLVTPLMPCGECDACRRGAAAACPRGQRLGHTANGTLASHVVARGRWLLPLQDRLDVPGPAAAMLGGHAATAYAAFARAGVSPGEPVVIVGDNTIARFTAQIATAKGAHPFLAGAASGDAAETVEQQIETAGHVGKPRRIFETSAHADERRLALSLANPGATVAMLSRDAAGAAGPDADVQTHGWLAQHAAVLGIAGAHPDFAAEVVALAVRDQLDLTTSTQLVTPEQLPNVAATAAETGPVPILDLRPR